MKFLKFANKTEAEAVGKRMIQASRVAKGYGAIIGPDGQPYQTTMLGRVREGKVTRQAVLMIEDKEDERFLTTEEKRTLKAEKDLEDEFKKTNGKIISG